MEALILKMSESQAFWMALVAIVPAMAMVVEPSAALAAGGAGGAGGAAAADPFGTLLTTVRGWLTGSLGKLLAVISLIVAGFGGATGNLRLAIVALGLAAILAFGPGVIDAIFTSAG